MNLSYHEYEADHELNGDMQRDFDQWITQQLDVERT
jgi:hypothetical protein